MIRGKRVQQDDRRALAEGPVRNFGVVALDALGKHWRHLEIKSQWPAPTHLYAFVRISRTNHPTADECTRRYVRCRYVDEECYGVVLCCVPYGAEISSGSSGITIHAIR